MFRAVRKLLELRSSVLFFLGCSVFAAALCPADTADAASRTRVEIEFTAPVVTAGKDGARLSIAGAGNWAPAGAPLVPWRQVNVLLPDGSTVGEVRVSFDEPIALKGKHRLLPAQAGHAPIEDEVPAFTPPDPKIYGSDDVWPRVAWRYHGVGYKHGRAVAILSVCPVRYRPRSSRVSWTPRVVVEVSPRARAKAGRLVGGLSKAKKGELTDVVDNPDSVERGDGEGGGAGGGVDDVVHAIITSSELAASFEPLAAHRRANGTPSEVFTTDWIYTNYDGTRPDGGEDDATRIRNFIADFYASRGLRWVLLGGDADGDADCDECEDVIVPTRYLSSRALAAVPIPADMYFGCLDGSFDDDADGIYGEPVDGPDGGDVDFLFEVHVGRAPVDSSEEATNFVEKTIAYDGGNGPVLREVLLVGEFLGFGGAYDFGGNLNDQIRFGSVEFIDTVGFESSPLRDFFSVSTLYDRNVRWTPEVLASILREGVHLVNHVGHADISNVMKMTNAEIDALDGEHPFIAYSQSCYAGAFDNRRTHGGYGSDSVVEHFLASPSGAVAFIACSRRGWASRDYLDGPSHRFNREFWNAVLGEGALRIGQATDRAKEQNIAYIALEEKARWSAYEINTFGDPILGLRLAGPRGSLSIDRDFYNPGDGVHVTVIDSDLDLDRDSVDSVTIQARALASGDVESIELLESGRASGVFQATVDVATGEVASNQVIETTPPDTIVLEYFDADDGDGGSGTRDVRATVADIVEITSDCPPAGFLGIPYQAQLEAGGGVPPYTFSARDDYREALEQPFFQGIGYPQGWDADDSFWSFNLPFSFPFYAREYELVLVSSNGFLEFGGGNALDFANSTEKLAQNTRIAPMWADLVTSGAGDIYVRVQPGSVSFRWSAENYFDGESANVECELFSDGRIRFGYGFGNLDLSPTIGISAGDGVNFVISELNGRDQLSNAPAVHFLPTRPPEGISVQASTGLVSGVPGEVFSGEVAFQVMDSFGQSARRVCRLDILPDGLNIISPRESSTAENSAILLLRGSTQLIQWEWFGEIGENVRVDYNTTGSQTEFPESIAKSVPLASRSLSWDVPDIVAERVRIRVQSIEQPRFLTFSSEFSIVGPTIHLRLPTGGERWIVGDSGVVAWRNIGETGDRVRIDYNTDGSLDVFPLNLTESVANSGHADVDVPSTVSTTCRLRVQSLSDASIFAVSEGTFSMVAPSIALSSPNGGECLRAGSEVQILWMREGETGGQVIFEYNTDGSATEFPFQIGAGPAPNSGAFEWTVPFELGSTYRLRVRSRTRPEITDVSDGTFSVQNRCETRALIWVPFVPAGSEQVIGVLQAARRFDKDFLPFYSTDTTPEALRSALADKDAMVFPRQRRGFGVDFDGLGRRLGPVIREFMARGGAFVVCQQTSRAEAFLRAAGFLEFQRWDTGTVLCEVADPFHPLALGVRPNFGGPLSTSWYQIDSQGVDKVVRVSDGQTVVASRTVGFGRLVFLGFDYYAWNDDTARILDNAMQVDLPAGGIRLTSPSPGQSFRPGQQVPIRWFSVGEARGLVRIEYGTSSTPGEFPFEVGEAESNETGDGELLWTAPPLADEERFTEVRVRVTSIGAPEHFSVFAEPFYIVRAISIATETLPEASIGIPYHTTIEVEGGVPPFTFDTRYLPPGFVVESPTGEYAELRGTAQAACENCEIGIFVRDSIGLEANRFLPFPIVPREINILQPNGGELLLFGSDYEVLWEHSGDVGETVRISYNLTGGTDEFPNVIAESLPVEDGRVVWAVPPVTASQCRMRVQSNEASEIRATSRTPFRIVGPTIALDSPAGGECWVPGTRRRIAWRSVGNENGTVRIDFNVDGSSVEFPFVISTGEPSSGELLWEVPDLASTDCRVRVSFENAAEITDTSAEVFTIGEDCGLSVVLWSPCPGVEDNEAEILAALESRTSTLDVTRTSTRQRLILGPLLFNRDALIIPLMSICQTLDYEVLGQYFESTLTDYVREGGVVIFCAPSSFSSRFLAGLGLFERLRILRAQGGLPCEVSSPLHPIVDDVPLGFEGPFSTAAFALIGSKLESLVESDDATVVSALDVELGRWVILGFNFQTSNEESALILANSSRMRSRRADLRVLSPLPREVFVAGEEISIEWAAGTDRGGLVEILYNTTGSPTEFPMELAVVNPDESGGLYSWTAPSPPAGEYLTLAVEVRWQDEPAVLARSEGPFYVTEAPFEIVTTELPVGRLGAEYIGGIRVSGGVAPFEFVPSPLPSGLFLEQPDPADPHVANIVGVPLENVVDFEFRVQITDTLGSVVETSYLLKVLPSRLILLSPSGGEFLLVGSQVPVFWEIRGNVGQTVKVEYNLTGARDRFEYVAAEAAPAHEEFVWPVPETPSERCRMRITSNEVAGLSSVSEETFTITAPGITCLSPNGSESFDSGSLRTIRWRSRGNPSGQVRIKLYRDGAKDPGPTVVVASADDTGAYQWQLPDDAWETCRLSIVSTTDEKLADESDAPFAIRHYNAVDGLIWIPFTSHSELEVRGAVAAITTVEFDFDWRLSVATEPSDLRRELRGKKTFVVVQQDRRPDISFGARGRELAPILREFVEYGGTVVVLKQLGTAREFLPATGLLDVTEIGTARDVECEIAFVGHPMVNQVDDTFQSLTATSWFEIGDSHEGEEPVDVFATHGEHPVALGRDIGDGRVIAIGFDYRDYNSSTANLLANATRMARFVDRVRFVRGDTNGDSAVNIVDAIRVLSWLFQGAAEPPCLDAADVDDSAVLGSIVPAITIGDGIYLLDWLFLGGSPPPAPTPARANAPGQQCGLERRERDGLGCERYACD